MNDPEPEQRPRGSSGRKILAILLGGGGTLLAILLYQAWSREGRWSELTPESLQTARQRWENADIDDYHLEIEVFGRQPGLYRVEVRDGVPHAAWRNGSPLRQRRTWATWSVPGMFGTISRDLEHIERVKAGRADASTPRLLVRVMFDEQSGLPRRYLRIERGGIGGNPEVRWEVKEWIVDSG